MCCNCAYVDLSISSIEILKVSHLLHSLMGSLEPPPSSHSSQFSLGGLDRTSLQFPDLWLFSSGLQLRITLVQKIQERPGFLWR